MSTDEDHMPPEMQQKFIQLTHTPMACLAYAAAGQPVYLVGILGTARGAGAGDAAPDRARLHRGLAEHRGE